VTDPELHLDDQSLSADSQPGDLWVTSYAAKGKAKKLRRIFGTATGSDVGNVVIRQRKFQPADRLLGPWGVSFFPVLHSPAYLQIYILIDVFLV